MTDAERELLEAHAHEALRLLGLPAPPDRRVFILEEREQRGEERGAPRLDLDGLLTDLKARGNPVRRFFGQLIIQYRVERFLEILRGQSTNPGDAERNRIESLALGICQQLLLFRLPRHSSKELAVWLMNPNSAPRLARPVLREILWIQRERNTRSAVWAGMFEDETGGTPPPTASTEPRRESGTNSWEGLPVHRGQAEGPVIVDPNSPDDLHACHLRPILVFSAAKPDTVRFFSHAAAVLYARGSVLSHACSLAREQGLPCVTGLGTDFVRFLNDVKPLRLRVQADTGKVMVIPDKP